MLKRKLQYFGPLDAKNPFIGKDSDLGKDGGQEEKETLRPDAMILVIQQYKQDEKAEKYPAGKGTG